MAARHTGDVAPSDLTFQRFFEQVFLTEYAGARGRAPVTVSGYQYLVGAIACRWIGATPIGAVDGGVVARLEARLREETQFGGAGSIRKRGGARALQDKCQLPGLSAGLSTVTVEKALTVLEYVLRWSLSAADVSRSITLQVAADQFFAARADDLAPSSAILYRYHLRRHVLPYIGSMTIGQVTDGVRGKLRETLSAQGRRTAVFVPGAVKRDGSLKKPWEIARDKRRGSTARADGRRFSDQTIRSLVIAIRMVLKWAEARKYIARCPEIEIPSVSKPRRALPYSAAEARALVANAATDQRRVMYLINFDTGCRKSELLGLHWEQVDWAHHCITFDRQRYRGVSRQTQKRLVPMSPPLELALKRLRLAHGSLSSFVFCQPDGAPLEAHHLRTFEERDAEAAGLRKVVWQHKRHPVAHQVVKVVIEAGLAPWEMQYLLGQTDIRPTETDAKGEGGGA